MLPTSHSELDLPSTGSWLPSRLTSMTPFIERIFPNLKSAKKRDMLGDKQESGMVLKKRVFTPESGNVDTYEIVIINTFQNKIT